MTIWLYTTSITPRLQWVADWLGNQLIGSALPLTNNLIDIGEDDAVINYSVDRLLHRKECHIVPQGLLHNDAIEKQPIDFDTWHGLPIFFTQASGHIPFDVLAASFFLLQRYEEHLPHSLDEYDRYHHINSLAFIHNFLHRPLVDEWGNELQQLIKKTFGLMNAAPPAFRLQLTYDVDMAWSTKHKGLFSNMRGIAKAIKEVNPNALYEKLLVASGNRKDPYDIFDELEQLHELTAASPIYFWLLAEKYRGYDKNISPTHPALQQLIKQVAQKHDCGIHLSWQAEKDGRIMARECALLEEILQKPVHKNRFHYLNIHLPDSYRRMLQHCPNISDDFSMAYGTINGFRASTSRPYRWYNLVANKGTSLTLHPAAWMDANCIFEEQLSPRQSVLQFNKMKQTVEKTGGNFISIAHNHFMANNASGTPWKQAYFEAINAG